MSWMSQLNLEVDGGWLLEKQRARPAEKPGFCRRMVFFFARRGHFEIFHDLPSLTKSEYTSFYEHAGISN